MSQVVLDPPGFVCIFNLRIKNNITGNAGNSQWKQT